MHNRFLCRCDLCMNSCIGDIFCRPSLEEVGTNHMINGAWNANSSRIFTSWQSSAGACWAVSRDLGNSSHVYTGTSEGYPDR